MIVCNSDDVTQSHSQEMHSQMQNRSIVRKHQPLSVHGRHQIACQMRERIGNPNKDIGMEFGIEKCSMLVMKNRKVHMREGIELPNQEKK